MFERSYAITIKDKQGKIYYLTEEMTFNIWSRKDGSKKSSNEYNYFFRKRTEDVCLHNVKLFSTKQIAKDFWNEKFENNENVWNQIYSCYDTNTLAVCKIVLVRKVEELL